MLHIAICDDEPVEIKYLTSLIQLWQANHPGPVQISTFENANQFLFAYEDMPSLHILLLDIQMGEGAMDGMGLARHLRQSNQDLQIIFITGYAGYMADGYDVSALHYLMKPVKDAQFFNLLDKAVGLLDVKDPELIVQTAQGPVRLFHKDIVMIEAFAHYVHITTPTQVVETRANIGDIVDSLGDSFVRCHRSYVVGLRHVKQIGKTDVVLDDGRLVPLSRRMQKDVQQGFISYYKGRI